MHVDHVMPPLPTTMQASRPHFHLFWFPVVTLFSDVRHTPLLVRRKKHFSFSNITCFFHNIVEFKSEHSNKMFMSIPI